MDVYSAEFVENFAKAESLASGGFIDLDREAVHKRYLEMTEGGKKTPERTIQHIYERMQMHFMTTTENLNEYRQNKWLLDEIVWPKLRQRVATNYGLAQLMLEFGVHSQLIPQFALDMQETPGVAILMGHGIGHTINDQMTMLPLSDPAYQFFLDASFQSMRFRAKMFQETMTALSKSKKNLKVAFLGGGCDPSLYARGFKPGADGRQITIFDNDPRMKKYFGQMIGDRNFSDLGIDYQLRDVTRVINNPVEYGKYDLLIVSGLVCYFLKEPGAAERFFRGLNRLLKKNGILAFDLQSANPVLMFDVEVLGWSSMMKVFRDVKEAIMWAGDLCRAGDFEFLDQRYQQDYEMPAGVVFWARKNENGTTE